MNTGKRKKPSKKVQKAEVPFSKLLAIQLNEAKIGEVTTGRLSDDSGSWVDFRIGKKLLCFQFNDDGNKLEDVGLFQDLYAVVGQKKLFGTK